MLIVLFFCNCFFVILNVWFSSCKPVAKPRGARRVGARRVGARRVGGPKFRAFFSVSCHKIHSFSLSGVSWNLG